MYRWIKGVAALLLFVAGSFVLIFIGINVSPGFESAVVSALNRKLGTGVAPEPWYFARTPGLSEAIGREMAGVRVSEPWKCDPERCGFHGVQFAVFLPKGSSHLRQPHSDIVGQITRATVRGTNVDNMPLTYPRVGAHRVVTPDGIAYVVMAADLDDHDIKVQLRDLVAYWTQQQYGPPPEPELLLGSNWKKISIPELDELSREMDTVRFAGAWTCFADDCKAGARVVVLRYITQPDGMIRMDVNEARQLHQAADAYNRSETDEIYRSNSVFIDYNAETNAPRFMYRVSTTHENPMVAGAVLARVMQAFRRKHPLDWALINNRLRVK